MKKTKKKAKRIPNIRVTVEMLDKMGACDEERNRFNDLWPKGVMPTKKTFERAQKERLSVFWFGESLGHIRGFKTLKKFFNQRLDHHDEKFGGASEASDLLATVEAWKAYCQMVHEKAQKKAKRK